MAVNVLKSMRAGLESTRGTGVAMTRGIQFVSGFHDQTIDLLYPAELRNSYHVNYLGDPGAETNTFEFEGAVSTNAILWWLNLHAAAVASGTGAGADKTWTFVGNSASDNLKTATIQFGYSDNIGASVPAWSVPYVIGQDLTITWAKVPGDPGIGFKSTLTSPKAATQISAFTGTGTYIAEPDGLVKAKQTTVTIDSTTIGTTADNDIISGEWTLHTNPVLEWSLNNSANAQDLFRPQGWDWELKLRRYYRNDTEIDSYVAKTLRKIRFKTVGSALGGSNYSFQVDLYGKYSSDSRRIAEDNGLGIEEYTLKPIYDSGLTSSFQVVVVTDQSTIT